MGAINTIWSSSAGPMTMSTIRSGTPIPPNPETAGVYKFVLVPEVRSMTTFITPQGENVYAIVRDDFERMSNTVAGQGVRAIAVLDAAAGELPVFGAVKLPGVGSVMILEDGARYYVLYT